MLVEDQRFLHEDLERLEQAISDRVLDDPRNIRDRLNRDHQIAHFLDRISAQSSRLIDIYADPTGERALEIQNAGTGEPFDAFYKQLGEIKEFHRKYPSEPVENLERSYRRRGPGEDDRALIGGTSIDAMFSGEESYGRFFDLTGLHEQYLNLPGVQNVRRFSYLQYLDFFDVFTPPQCVIKRPDKLRDEYFQYVSGLASYLESFMRRTKLLDPLDKIFSDFDTEFADQWEADKVPGWSISNAEKPGPSATPAAEGTGEGIWCADCGKEFKNDNVYKNHLSGKKHLKAVGAKKASSKQNGTNGINGDSVTHTIRHRLKERAVASHEFRVCKLAASMQTVRSDTKVNVERRAGMTERERQQEIEALYAESLPTSGDFTASRGADEGSDDEDGDKIYNPLKLPLAWDGKPIPFWLYKLHGLGVEYPCEICGNFVYMGRRAFDKHFNEARHIYGLKCLGITNTTLFREITSIEEAVKLWTKVTSDKTKEEKRGGDVVQMEDAEGNVMPEKVYWDLQKQGLV